MENLIKIGFLIVLGWSSFSNGQEAFYKTYSGSMFDEGQGIVQMADSGYVITGSTAGFSDASDVFLTRLNKFGEFEWSKKFGGENSDRGSRVFYEEGNGLWCVGYTNSLTAQSFDFYMFKTDENGLLEWETVWGTPDWERLYDAVRLPNGDFILVGETQGSAALNEDILVVRLDDTGNEVWSERIQTSGSDIPYALSILNDTTVVIAGESFDGSNQVAFLSSMHIDGTMNWLNYYEQSLHGTFFDVDCVDDNIYAAGGLIAAGGTEPDLWMIRTDAAGSVIYDHIDTYDGTVYFSNVRMAGDGRLYVSIISDAPSFNPFTNGVDHFFMKYHQNLFWNGLSQSFSGVNDDLIHQMISTNDGGIAMIGTVSDNRVIDSPGTDITVIKIGENDELEQFASSDELVSVLEFEQFLVEVFPNPMTNALTIKVPLNSQANYVLHAGDGRVLMSGTVSYQQLDVSQLPSGIYLLQLEMNGQMQTMKLVK